MNVTAVRRVVNASVLVGALFGVDKIAGLARQVIVGQTYGLSAETDAFNAANNVPDALFAVISGGALAIALIPVLTEARERAGRPALWELFTHVANLAFVVTAGLAALVALAPLPIVQNFIAPGFAPEQQALTASLMRLYLIATVIFSISGLVMGALQANQHFLMPALAPLLYNLGQIGGVLVLSERFGIYGLVYGVILGALLHLGVQLPALVRYGFRWAPALSLRHPGVRQVLALMGPRVLTIACFNLIFIARDRLASGLPEGAITALAYGWLIMQLPETVIGTAAGTAILPTLSELAARGARDELRRLLRRALLVLAAVTAPVALLAIGLLPLAVRLVFEGRAFTAEDSAQVVLAARLFMLGLVGHSIKEVTARTFYALQDARTPLITAAINLAVFVSLAAALTPAWGVAALAVADSLAFSLEAILMLAILYRRRVL
jgi:putative peptidoglycan lipid II flippase